MSGFAEQLRIDLLQFKHRYKMLSNLPEKNSSIKLPIQSYYKMEISANIKEILIINAPSQHSIL